MPDTITFLIDPIPSFGAELIAAFVSVAFWGITLMQTFIYFVNYQGDRLLWKCLVIWLFILDSLHQVLVIKGVYDTQINNFCNYEVLQSVSSAYLWQIVPTALTALTSQMFVLYRVSRLTGRSGLFALVFAPIALFQLGGSIAFVVICTIHPTSRNILSIGPKSLWIAVNATVAFADISVSAALSYVLLHLRRDGMKRNLTSLLQALSLATINTGILTALVSIFELVTLLAFRHDLFYTALYFPLCPLYCNTILANLNAKNVMRRKIYSGAVDENEQYTHNISLFTDICVVTEPSTD